MPHLSNDMFLQFSGGRERPAENVPEMRTFGYRSMWQAPTSMRSRFASRRRSLETDSHRIRRPLAAQNSVMSAAIWRPLPTPAPSPRKKPGREPVGVRYRLDQARW